jgi:hypothetical protein
MVNWYYVVGSERVGPISEDALKVLYINNEITQDTYVWKKGFANWERIKEVSELFAFLSTPESAEGFESSEAHHVEQSPELYVDFSWEGVDENEEIFFIKIGKDRQQTTSNLFGPYSFIELEEALKEKRISLQTFIYSPGMQSWMSIADTPLNTSLNSDLIQEIVNEPNPAYFVINKDDKYVVGLLKSNSQLIGDKTFLSCLNANMKASLYVGNELKAKDINLNFTNYDSHSQLVSFKMKEKNREIESIIKSYV